MANYLERSVTCMNCAETVRVEDTAQTLRFRYLCGDCTAGGYRLGAFADSPLTPRRWYIHVMVAGRIVEGKGAKVNSPSRLWGPA